MITGVYRREAGFERQPSARSKGTLFLATKTFTDEAVEALRRFLEADMDELFRCFTLTRADVAFIDSCRGRGRGSVGFAVAREIRWSHPNFFASVRSRNYRSPNTACQKHVGARTSTSAPTAALGLQQPRQTAGKFVGHLEFSRW